MIASVAAAGLLAGCSRKPVELPIDRLSFPVVLVVGTSSASPIPSHAEVIGNAEDLRRMRVEIYSPLTDPTISDPPMVIDSTADVLEMKNIKGERGGLWMMAHPTGLMPISFTLVRHRETGIEAARLIISNCRFLGGDLDDVRRELRAVRIRRAETMAEIMQIVDEMPAPDADEGESD